MIDGSAISANVGVNPALTICALAERAISMVPPKVAVDRDLVTDPGEAVFFKPSSLAQSELRSRVLANAAGNLAT